jgi:putative ABC transport system permease protein
MTFVRRLVSIASWVLRRNRAEQQLDDEVRSFVEMSTADKIRDGLPPAEARRLALAEIGGVEHVKESVRTGRHGALLDEIGRDIRYAIRMSRRHPGFASVTVLCLSLGVGANAAVFSVFSAMLLRPLPYADADRLGIVYKTGLTQRDQISTFGPAEFLDWRDQTQSFESLAMYVPWSPSLTEVEQAAQLTGIRGSGSLLRTLGVAPMLGRTFDSADEISGQRVAVISNRLWQEAFHGDPALLNRDVVLDGQRYVVVGIMPAAFQFPGRQVDVWSLLTIPRERIDRGETGFPMLARLRAGVSWEHARAELDARIAGMRREYAKTYDETAAGVVPLRDWFVDASQQRTLWLLIGAVAVLLLTTCANVANLMIVHSSARRQEIVVRLALGATRGRVVGQLLTEFIVLGALGGAIGLLLSLWARSAFVNLLPAGSPYQLVPVVLDWRVASYSLVLSMGSVIVAGLLPALKATRSELLTQGVRVTRVNMRGVLLVVQTAATVVLLAGAVLLVRSFMNVWRIDPGFSRAHVLATRIKLPNGRPAAAQTEFYDRLLDRLSYAPQVESVGAVSFLPLSGEGSGSYITIEGRPDLDVAHGTQPGAARLSVTPGFFDTLAIPVLEGRTFSRTDPPAASLVVINHALARRFFPDASPIGRRIKRGTLQAPFPWMTIVGVVGDVKLMSLFDDAQPTFFLSHAQTPTAAMTVVLRTPASTAVAASHVRSAVSGLDRNLPVGPVRAFDDLVLDSLADTRFPMLWIACFSILALVLSALGVYGVVSYTLLQRRREFVIRMVLGASPSGLTGLALRHGLWPTAIGCIAGLAAALALGHLLANRVYGVDVWDRTSLTVALTLPLLVALASSYPAVRRVAGVNPATILHID